jgi:hypothetical protein
MTTSLAMLTALMSVALAEPTKDQGQAEARPIRVILPAPWEPAPTQAEAPPAK